ncbi:MAG: response regulator [Candidatus Omnitrophica bacterium]|nr:response regulator [Candidatus Omnitrophota bacterium]
MARKSKIRKILVVDDDRTITVLIKKYLEKNGYEVTAINEASEGLEFAMTRKPDLIILDVMMPIINGFNFCRLLKAEEGSKDIPIILLTSRNKLKDIEIGLEMGAEAYLIKPLNIEELIKTIRVIESAEQ